MKIKIKILNSISNYFVLLCILDISLQNITKDINEAPIQAFQNHCSLKCQECNGPSENNCLSCDLNKNRIFLEEYQECVCQQGYLEFDRDCILVSEIFTDFSINEQIIEQTFEQEQLCELGFYLKPISQYEFQCFKCPIREKIQYYCLECIFNPQTWYIRPNCEYYLQSRLKLDDDSFQVYSHPAQYYLIDQNFNLIFYPFIKNYCEEIQDCVSQTVNHLGQTFQVNIDLSKYVYFFKTNNLLINLILFCFNARQTHRNCQRCIDSKQISQMDLDICEKIFDSQDILCNYWNNDINVQASKHICTSFCSKCYEGLCLQCVEGYFLQADGSICLKNNIAHCKQAFQIVKQTQIFNYYENLSFEQSQGIVLCERCEDYYVFVFSIGKCLKMYENKCIFAVASRIILEEYNQLDEQIAYLDGQIVYTSYQWCLDTQNVVSKLFFYGCESEILFCIFCLQINDEIWVCLQCDRIIPGTCIMDKQINIKDFVNWVYLMDFNSIHRKSVLKNYVNICNRQDKNQYFESGFSVLNFRLARYDQYEKYKRINQNACHMTCQECTEEGICLRCKQNSKGRPQSSLAQNKECIECPYNCSLCYPRTWKQIFEVNPFFNNVNLTKYTVQCIQLYQYSNQIPQFFYDKLFRRFIQCQDGKPCKKLLNISLNLFCSKDEFDTQLASLSGLRKNQFILNNLLFEEFVKNPFSLVKMIFNQFHNSEFYEIANQKSIRIISIQITSQSAQICRSTNQIVISNKFSENIFSALCEVNIDFHFEFVMTFEIADKLVMENFSSIFIQNIKLIAVQSTFSIIFSNILAIQQISLNNISFIGDMFKNNKLFTFINSIKVAIKNFIMNQSNFQDSSIFQIDSNQESQRISLSQISVFNITFQTSALLIVQQLNGQNLTLEKILIDYCQFIDSAFLKFANGQSKEFLETRNLWNFILKDMLIQSTLISFLNRNIQCFMKLDDFIFVDISNFTINSSQLNNCKILKLNHHSIINNFYQSNCNLTDSYIITNSDTSKAKVQFHLANIVFIQNTYFGSISFMTIMKFKTNSNTQAKFINLNISDNYCYSKKQLFSNFLLNQSLLYIELDDVLLENNFISRGLGFSEISLVRVKNLQITHTLITSKLNQRVFHLRKDCNQDVPRDQNVVLNLYSINDLLLDEMNISNLLAIDSPIIFYRAESSQSQSQFPIIKLHNITAQNNVILTTNSQAQVGIIKVEINRQCNIVIINCNFYQNILKGIGRESIQQSLILNIQAKYSSFELYDSYFESNIALNTRNSIISISSKSIILGNCQFFKNNQLYFEILRPYIFWDFYNTETVLNEDFEKILKVESESGSGIFDFQTMIMENLSVSNSVTGFKFIANNQSSVSLKNLTFSTLETNLIENNIIPDGTLLFDSSNSINFTLLIQNISAESIFLFNYGSLIQILASPNTSNITILNIHANNIFSLSASLININHYNQSKFQQNVKISKVYYSANSIGWYNFLQRYIYLKILNSDYVQITSEIYSKRTIFQASFGTDIEISKIFLSGLNFSSVLNLNEVTNVRLLDIQILNSTIITNLINIKEKLNYEKILNNQENGKKIIIRDLIILNISSLQIQQVNCAGQKRQVKVLQCFENTTTPTNLQSLEVNINQQCNFQDEVGNSPSSLIQILNVQDQNQIYIKYLNFQLVNCSYCQLGLLQIQFINSMTQLKLKLLNLFVIQSNCGDVSCVFMEKQVNLQRNQENNKQLDSQSIIQQNEILIQNYICQNNTAKNGTCLNINGLKLIIKDSIFQYNKASLAGGALYFKNNQNFIIIEQSIIHNNYAILGGGIYLENQVSLNYHLLKILILNNIAFTKGKNIYSSPTLLFFKYGEIENMCTIQKIQNETFIIDQVVFARKVKIFGFETQYLLFPNGQKIQQYKLFDWKNRKYLHPNLDFRIIAMSNKVEKFVNLQNSFCHIRSGLAQHNQLNSIQNTNNYTSLNIIYFNLETEDYNLDDLEINFPSEFIQNDSLILSLEFQCYSISIPIFNQNYPYNYISEHQNYSIRFFLKPFPCQFGEIRNMDLGTCNVCDSQQGFFSLQINQSICLIKEDISTLSVQPAQLQLRQGFWRPYFDTSIIGCCYNLPQNCLGGWVEGDTSCLLGHIGALCEQCDIQNIRGDGKFFQTNSYDCQSCDSQINQIILIAFITIYILITILVSALSNIESVKSQLILIRMKILGLRVQFQFNQKAILFKLITNYFQILGLVSNFQSSFNHVKFSFILNITTPSETLTTSFDCLLSQHFKLSIHYIRILILILQPLLFIIIIFCIFSFSYLFKKIQLNLLLISTTLIYIYIYFQPNLVGKLVQLLSYREISNYKWILANVAFRYDDYSHFYWMVYFLIPVLLLISLIIPMFLLYGLHTNKKILDKKSARLKWGYLYCEYKPETYKWEILRIFKKIILLGLLNYYQNFPLTQVILTVLILLLYLQFAQSFKPYYSQKLNNIDYQSMVTCLILIIFPEVTNNKLIVLRSYYFQEIIFFILNIRLMKIIFTQLLSQYLQSSSINFKMKLDLIRESIRKKFPFLNKFKSIQRMLKNQIKGEQRTQDLFKKLKEHLLQQGKLRQQQKQYKLKIPKINDATNQIQKFFQAIQGQ